MFLTIAKFLYLDLKEQRLKMVEPANEMKELEEGSKKIQLMSAAASSKAKKKGCEC